MDAAEPRKCSNTSDRPDLPSMTSTRSLSSMSSCKSGKDYYSLRYSKEVLLEERSPLQRRVAGVMTSFAYEICLCGVVLFNIGLMIIDVDASTSCRETSCTPYIVEVLDYILLTIYSLDVAFSLYWQQCHYFREPANYVDLLIVLFGYFELIMMFFAYGGGASLSMVRMLRMARVMRLARLLKPLPELYMLVTGFVGTIRAIFWGFIMICLLLVGWSILLLQAMNAFDVGQIFAEDSWCREGGTSTMKLALMLWQTLIAGDAWGTCAIPVILNHPWLYFLYAGAFLTVNLGFTNLILAVIVDNSNNMHEKDKIRKVLEQKEQHEKDIEGFRSIFEAIDKDNTNTVSVDECMLGYDESDEFRCALLKFGLERSDLTTIFDCLDEDGDGFLTYDEFIHVMFKTQRHASNIQLMMIQMSMKKLFARTQKIEDLISKNVEGSVRQTLSEYCGTTTASVVMPQAFLGSHCASNDVLKKMPDLVDLEDTLAQDKARLGALSFKSDMDCLCKCALETIELRFNAAANALQQQSMAFARETEQLSFAFQHISGYRDAPARDAMPSDDTAMPSDDAVEPLETALQEGLTPLSLREDETDFGEVLDGRMQEREGVALCNIVPCFLSTSERDA